MRSSPAYKAVQQLPEGSEVKTQNNVRPMCASGGQNYFHIAPKQAEHTTFTLGGVEYQTDTDLSRIPHLSVYKNFKLSEGDGLSVFHSTSYATSVVEEVVADTSATVAAASTGVSKREAQTADCVVIHVYFSQTGAYLSSQVKKESVQAEDAGAAAMVAASTASTTDVVTLTPVEEAALRRHALHQVGPAVSEILQHVHKQSDQARQKADRTIAALERMPLRNLRDRAAYLGKVKACIRELTALVDWSFTRGDSRLSWFKTLVASTPDQQRASVVAAASSASLFSEPAAVAAGKVTGESDDENEAAESAASAAAKPRPKLATPPQQRAAALREKITAQIEAINKKLQALDADGAKEAVAKAIEKHQLLQDKMALIAEGGKHVSGDVVQATFLAI